MPTELDDMPTSFNSGSPYLDELLNTAAQRWNAMSIEQRKAHRQAQRESWVRGELALAKLKSHQ